MTGERIVERSEAIRQRPHPIAPNSRQQKERGPNTDSSSTSVFRLLSKKDGSFIRTHKASRGGELVWKYPVVMRLFLAGDDDIQKLRLVLHNIVDKGLSERQKSIKEEFTVWMGGGSLQRRRN